MRADHPTITVDLCETLEALAHAAREPRRGVWVEAAMLAASEVQRRGGVDGQRAADVLARLKAGERRGHEE
ncbi:hypothetical protein [Paraliomyxa miuraensis]|uniref:hypothetical protein n=1 Tax=Paraliomyxa miuraensis TaxID=376150 RepID=UPI00225905AB|nr:hypothetical protein [Paraliomyxa miuraensis]MCX4239605.1 hypothetical protein [Paraliomyxa miuraensis]